MIKTHINRLGLYLEYKPFATAAVLVLQGPDESGLRFSTYDLEERHLRPLIQFVDGDTSVLSRDMEEVFFDLRQDMRKVAEQVVKLAKLYQVESVHVGWMQNFRSSWASTGEVLAEGDIGDRGIRPAWSYLPYDFLLAHLTMQLRQEKIPDPIPRNANGLDMTCFRCGHRNPRNVWREEFDCRRCRHKLPRAYNAAAWLTLKG